MRMLFSRNVWNAMKDVKFVTKITAFNVKTSIFFIITLVQKPIVPLVSYGIILYMLVQ